MGGQACVFYGAAEFSRDIDFAILADSANLARLRGALADLQAEAIAVPPFQARFLARGHAIHFRCEHPEASQLRIDIMSKMRGVDSFAQLWKRRTVIELSDATMCDLLSLPDLVQAKKTQRDKDWPMLRRLVEAHYFENREQTTPTLAHFWLRELRTPNLLIALAKAHPTIAKRLLKGRLLLTHAIEGDADALADALQKEESTERARDRDYWQPRLRELEALRHQRLK